MEMSVCNYRSYWQNLYFCGMSEWMDGWMNGWVTYEFVSLFFSLFKFLEDNVLSIEKISIHMRLYIVLDIDIERALKMNI